MKDQLGNEISGATPDALDHYERALGQLQTFTGDPVASVESAIVAAPGFVMAHALKGWLYGLATDPNAMAVAEKTHAVAAGLPATAREAGHVGALGLLVRGGWTAAGAALAEVSRDHPRDALALQAGHQVDFFTGNAPMLRDRIAAAMPQWDESMPGYHAVLSAHAFGLEETGDYAGAETAGRRAVELEPSDGWGRHAVAHVMEMQCRHRDGIAWMRTDPEWSTGSFLKVHNWWHVALFHHDLGDYDEVLALHDGPIYGDRPAMPLAMVDASALLWRLLLRGVDAGHRWAALAEDWAPYAGAGNYAFNDMHAMMAFAAAGRRDLARSLLDAQTRAAGGAGDNAAFTRDIGRPAAEAMLAFADGDHGLAARLLEPLPAIAHRFGGSHAQRDVIDLTLIEATIRAGDAARAARLSAERLAARPDSPLSHLIRRRAQDLSN